MSELYTLTAPGTDPVTLEVAKSHLKQTSAVDDDLITALLRTATDFAEGFLGRELRANTWQLLRDDFEARIILRRSPVATITSVKYTVATEFDTTVASSVYYLKKGLASSVILLQEDQSWPTDLKDAEQGVEIVFVTAAMVKLAQVKDGILRHVASLYEHRGDSDPGIEKAAQSSGALNLYGPLRIARI